MHRKTESTTLELLALAKLLSSLKISGTTEGSILLLVDSLSAIRLILGLDVRTKDLDILRSID